jgi:hypothetical protein
MEDAMTPKTVIPAKAGTHPPTPMERALGGLAAAFYTAAQANPVEAFHSMGAALNVLSGMRIDLIRTGKVKYEDL